MSDSRGRGVARQLHSGGQAGGQAQSLERDDDCLNRFWDSLLVCFLIQAVGWVVEAGSDDQTLFYGFA